MKRKTKAIAVLIMYTWLLLSFSGCEQPCYICYPLDIAIHCTKGNDTINTYALGTLLANDTVNFYQSLGYKCDTNVLGNVGCNLCFQGCGKKYFEQMERSGATCIEEH